MICMTTMLKIQRDCFEYGIWFEGSLPVYETIIRLCDLSQFGFISLCRDVTSWF